MSMEIGVDVPTVIKPAAVESRDKRENNRPIPANPYLVARREWDERYGSLITRAKNWRLVAILCAAIGLVQAGGMIWLSIRSKIVPYVVAVDSLGRQVAVGVVEETSAADDRLKRAAL